MWVVQKSSRGSRALARLASHSPRIAQVLESTGSLAIVEKDSRGMAYMNEARSPPGAGKTLIENSHFLRPHRPRQQAERGQDLERVFPADACLRTDLHGDRGPSARWA